ncbi:DUF4145 domain-containing protein [Pelagicoccus mobilis]|uniref:DUF4145 domain-containing protein n=1 Tax=Pelagicoccus mobilis TaxID=415221 RepID=A0A934RRK1_9BACT|nr:DUF4145 domain-containing protein [Pelagicoccus mobilis]MBK1875597.1 DUF4145 domain-containing protein [Pelagicoccus mobilis]
MKILLPNGSETHERIEMGLGPDTCPVCHHAGKMEEITDGYMCCGEYSRRPEILQFVYRCPRNSCGSLFITEYKKEIGLSAPYTVRGSYPFKEKRYPVPEEISDISSSFEELYSQALQAEELGLEDIHGMGLRKALEFLIKDYCIHLSPSDEEKIKKEFLGNVIASRVTDPNVKACAERAAWLGNDETHYERRWTSHDSSDLKRLVSLTINWIQSDVVTKRYLNEMEKK